MKNFRFETSLFIHELKLAHQMVHNQAYCMEQIYELRAPNQNNLELFPNRNNLRADNTVLHHVETNLLYVEKPVEI